MRVQLCQTPAKQPKRALTSGPRSDIQHGCAVTGFICDTWAHDHPPCSARCFQRAVRFSKGLARSYKTTSGFEPFSAFCVILVLHLLCLQTIHNTYRRHFQLFSHWSLASTMAKLRQSPIAGSTTVDVSGVPVNVTVYQEHVVLPQRCVRFERLWHGFLQDVLAHSPPQTVCDANYLTLLLASTSWNQVSWAHPRENQPLLEKVENILFTRYINDGFETEESLALTWGQLLW